MTYKELINKILTYASSINVVRQTGEGDIYSLNAKTDNKYSIVFITPGTHIETNNTIKYNINLFYIDRLNRSLQNCLDIQSTGIVVLSSILNQLKNDDSIYIIDDQFNYTPFRERFTDETAGVYASLSIEVPKPVDYCGEII